MALLKLNYDSLSHVSVGKVRFVHFMKACSYNVNFEMQIRFQTSCFPARKQESWWIHRRMDTGEAGPKHGVRGTQRLYYVKYVFEEANTAWKALTF